MHSIGHIIDRAFNARYWRNIGNYCNRITHPLLELLKTKGSIKGG